MTPTSKADSPGRGSLLIIFLTVFIDLLGFGIVLPLLPVYGKQFAADHGLSAAQVGWTVGLLMSVFSAMQFLFLPVWGKLSDRFGRRPILLLGLAASALCYTLFGLATVWRSLTWIFVARIGAGIAGATISTAQAYIADTTTTENRAKGMALIGAAFALGFTLGPLIGAASLFIGADQGLSPWPGYFAAGLSGTAFLLAIWLLPESKRSTGHIEEHALLDRSGLRTALSTPSLGWLLFASMIGLISFASFESTLALAVTELCQPLLNEADSGGFLMRLIERIREFGFAGTDEIQLVVVLGTFAYLGFVSTLAQGFLVRRVAGRVSDGSMAVGGSLAAVVGFALLAAALTRHAYGLLCVAMAIVIVGFAFITPALQSLISRRSSPSQQGHVLGVAQSLASLARILGPVLGIRLLAYSAPTPFWISVAVMIAATLLTAMAIRSGHDYEQAEAPA
jgi:DHA1 family tetracycline resistance protein-like MFS transporter